MKSILSKAEASKVEIGLIDTTVNVSFEHGDTNWPENFGKLKIYVESKGI